MEGDFLYKMTKICHEISEIKDNLFMGVHVPWTSNNNELHTYYISVGGGGGWGATLQPSKVHS